jgi:hypothetical protein
MPALRELKHWRLPRRSPRRATRSRIHWRGPSVRWRPANRCLTPLLSAASVRAVRPSAASAPLAQIGRRYARVCSAEASSVKQGWNTKRTHSCRSLTLRCAAASRCRFNASHCFPRAVGAGVLWHANAVNASLAHSGLVRLGGRPNPSVERTSNGGAHWRAPSSSVAPLAAAHLKR